MYYNTFGCALTYEWLFLPVVHSEGPSGLGFPHTPVKTNNYHDSCAHQMRRLL